MGQTGRDGSVRDKGGAGREVGMLLGLIDRRTRGVGEGRKVVLLKLLREGLGGCFWAARAVYEPFAIGELLKDLEVDILGLSAANGPLPFDDDDGDSADTTLASTIDLVFNRLSVVVRLEVDDGLILIHQARCFGDVAEEIHVRDILVFDDESMEEIGQHGLLKGLATLFPCTVNETVGTIGVSKNTAFANFKTKISESLCELLLASIGSLLTKGVSAISDPVLGLARFDGRMEYVRSVLDLEVKGVVLLGDLFNGAKDVFLTDVTEGTIEIVDDGEVNLLGSHERGIEEK